MPMVDMRKEPPRPIRGLLPLRAIERYPMPVGQRSAVDGARPDAVASAFSSALESGGFLLVPSSRTSSGDAGAALGSGREVFAERNVRRVPTHTGMRVSMGVLVGAGIALGAVDGVLVGGVWYTFPWFLGGLLAAGLLWWRYGRTYESEVIEARFSGTSPADRAPVGSPGTRTRGVVLWSAGRVRSVLFSGTRTAIGVLDCPIPLMEALGSVIRRFETEVASPGGVPPPPTAADPPGPAPVPGPLTRTEAT